jgi:hypothetical protein
VQLQLEVKSLKEGGDLVLSPGGFISKREKWSIPHLEKGTINSLSYLFSPRPVVNCTVPGYVEDIPFPHTKLTH